MRGMAWLLGISAGLGLTLQVGMNAQLRKVLDSANLAALLSFLVGTLSLVLLIIVTRTPLPDREALGGIPFWAWFGGVLGAFYVASATVVAVRSNSRISGKTSAEQTTSTPVGSESVSARARRSSCRRSA